MYVGNLSYDVKYRDLIEFMRGGGWGRFSGLVVFFSCGDSGDGWLCGASGGRPVWNWPPGGKRVWRRRRSEGPGQMASSVTPQRTQHPDVPWRSRVWAWAIEWGELQFPFSGF